MVSPVTSEILDIYDADGKHLGVAPRNEVHQKGLWHRSFHCWIIFESDKQEKFIVVQKRGPNAQSFPNYLDISAAGHYRAGEKIEGGIRELEEELGIKVESHFFKKMGVRTINEHLYNKSINREFQTIYFLKSYYPLSDYKPTYPEVTAVFHLPIQEVVDILQSNRNSISGWGIVADDNGIFELVQQTFTKKDFIPDSLHYLRFIMELASCYLDNPSQFEPESKQTRKAQTLLDGSSWQPSLPRG